MKTTKIQWADSTFNPWIGCTKVSPGCAHCYAERSPAAKFRGIRWGVNAMRTRTSEATWRLPLRWNAKPGFLPLTKDGLEVKDLHETPNGFAGKLWDGDRQWDKFGRHRRPGGICKWSQTEEGCCEDLRAHRRRVFPSLCDWLDPEVPLRWFADFLDLVRQTPNLDWLLLTKRPEMWSVLTGLVMDGTNEEHRELRFWLHKWRHDLSRHSSFSGVPGVYGSSPPNVWIGVSVENQAYVDERIGALMRIPARVRFLSVEPLLGPVDLRLARNQRDQPDCAWTLKVPYADWVIVGGESGPKARPCNVEWVRGVVGQCKASHVPVFVKQLGSNPRPPDYCEEANRVGCHYLKHPKGGDPAEWPEDLRVLQLPNP